jgi:hypothetical protein
VESRELGDYRLLAKLGSGGQADVYLALARGPMDVKRLAVVKRLRSAHEFDEEHVTMFLDEARLAARLTHPNVVTTYEVGHAEKGYFIAMEYLDGQPLEQVMRAPAPDARKTFTHRMWAAIIADALAGLHYAHELCDYDGTPLVVGVDLATVARVVIAVGVPGGAREGAYAADAHAGARVGHARLVARAAVERIGLRVDANAAAARLAARTRVRVGAPHVALPAGAQEAARAVDVVEARDAGVRLRVAATRPGSGVTRARARLVARAPRSARLRGLVAVGRQVARRGRDGARRRAAPLEQVAHVGRPVSFAVLVARAAAIGRRRRDVGLAGIDAPGRPRGARRAPEQQPEPRGDDDEAPLRPGAPHACSMRRPVHVAPSRSGTLATARDRVERLCRRPILGV